MSRLVSGNRPGSCSTVCPASASNSAGGGAAVPVRGQRTAITSYTAAVSATVLVSEPIVTSAPHNAASGAGLTRPRRA